MSDWTTDLRQAQPGWLVEETWTLVSAINGEPHSERQTLTGTVLAIWDHGLTVGFVNGQRFVAYDAESVRVRAP